MQLVRTLTFTYWQAVDMGLAAVSTQAAISSNHSCILDVQVGRPDRSCDYKDKAEVFTDFTSATLRSEM